MTPKGRLRLPRLLRTTAFRLTLLFLALFAASAAAFLAYVYVATAGEVQQNAEASVRRELVSLQSVYGHGGRTALNQEMIERAAGERPFFYLLMQPDGRPLTGNLETTPIVAKASGEGGGGFQVSERDLDGSVQRREGFGRQIRLSGGELLFVGADVGEAQRAILGMLRAIWGAGVLVIVLGLLGGLVISRNVARSMAALNQVVAAVEGGDLKARAPVRGVRDEYDELAAGLNAMLERLERSMGGLRHAGDAIAHDLRSPLTRLRARLEAAMIAVEAGRADPAAALAQALEDSDQVLRTFNAVLAISRLQAAGGAPNPEVFKAAELARNVAELYEPVCEEKGLSLSLELKEDLKVRGNREFLAQALANLLDNACKYTPAGGAVMLRVRRRSSGDAEFSITDTGPGIAEDDRQRVVERFVRLEASRSQPGAGLGLSLVAAVAEAHQGALELSEGPGAVDGMGPGLRTALILPAAA
jgi:signal transduction histidine kinase